MPLFDSRSLCGELHINNSMCLQHCSQKIGGGSVSCHICTRLNHVLSQHFGIKLQDTLNNEVTQLTWKPTCDTSYVSDMHKVSETDLAMAKLLKHSVLHLRSYMFLILHQLLACWIQNLEFVKRMSPPTSTMPPLASVNSLCTVDVGGMRTGSPTDWNA